MSDHLLRTLLRNILLSLHPPLSLSSSWTCHSHLSLAHVHHCNNAHSPACTCGQNPQLYYCRYLHMCLLWMFNFFDKILLSRSLRNPLCSLFCIEALKCHCIGSVLLLRYSFREETFVLYRQGSYTPKKNNNFLVLSILFLNTMPSL